MQTIGENFGDQLHAAYRWGPQFVMQDESPLHIRELMYFIRTAGELPIELRRVGWSSLGIPRQLQDTLAAHHQQVSLFCLLACMHLEKSSCTVDVVKILQMAGIHDLSEWGGGDAGVQRAKKDPEYKRRCRLIEGANRQKLALMLGNGFVANRYLTLATEEMEQKTDEAKIVKIMDGLEALLHLRRIRSRPFCAEDQEYLENGIKPILRSIENEQVKISMTELVEAFAELDENNQLGQVILKDSDEQLSAPQRLIRIANEAQMMKHVDRTAWAVGGVQKGSMDSLAEHGHATNIGVWTMVTALEELGMKIDMRKIISLATLQEAGKIYGGDVAVASIDPDDEDRKSAHYLRRGNFKLLFEFLPDFLPALTDLHEDSLVRDSVEAKLMMAMSRILDYLHYDLVKNPEYKNRYKSHTKDKILKLVNQIPDPEVRYQLDRAIKEMLVIIERGRLRRSVHSLIPSANEHILK